jgi:hypothetical protein
VTGKAFKPCDELANGPESGSIEGAVARVAASPRFGFGRTNRSSAQPITDPNIATLSALMQISAVQAHICSYNVFISAKVGFFSPVLKQLADSAALSGATPVFIKRHEDIESLQVPAVDHKRLVVILPSVGSTAVFISDLIHIMAAGYTVWVIAHPSSIEKHLLGVFHTFFIAFGTREEIKIFRDILPLNESHFDLLSKESIAYPASLFVTDAPDLATDETGCYMTQFRIASPIANTNK